MAISIEISEKNNRCCKQWVRNGFRFDRMSVSELCLIDKFEKSMVTTIVNK